MAYCDAHRTQLGLAMRSRIQHQGVPSSQHRRPERVCPLGWPAARFLACALAEAFLFLALISVTIRWSVAVFFVEGQSMEPTLHEGQHLLINTLSYRWRRSLQRGDIIVFQEPRAPSQYCIKRIIGLPGETVEVHQGHVYINDHLLHEVYIGRPNHDSWGPAVIPMRQCFVLGDNRGTSYDSSSWGCLAENDVLGKVWLSW